MSNSDKYKPFDSTANEAPAMVAVLANKLLAKKEAMDGHEGFGDIEAAVKANVHRNGDFSVLVYAEGSAQVDEGAKECPNIPIGAILAEAVIAEFDHLPKSARERIIERMTNICGAVRRADEANEPSPTKSTEKLISLAETVAPEIAVLAKTRLKERRKSPSIRTTGTAYILHAELDGSHVGAAVSPGSPMLGPVAELLANNRDVAKEMNVTVAMARKIARQAREAKTTKTA